MKLDSRDIVEILTAVKELGFRRFHARIGELTLEVDTQEGDEGTPRSAADEAANGAPGSSRARRASVSHARSRRDRARRRGFEGSSRGGGRSGHGAHVGHLLSSARTRRGSVRERGRTGGARRHRLHRRDHEAVQLHCRRCGRYGGRHPGGKRRTGGGRPTVDVDRAGWERRPRSEVTIGKWIGKARS